MRVSAAMTRDILCIAPADDLDAAHQLMSHHAIRHMPVLDGDELVGILSDRDVLLRSTRGRWGVTVPRTPVANAMSKSPIVCSPGSQIADVADLMLDNKIDCVPVLDESRKLVGLITSSDMLELLREKDRASGEIVPFKFIICLAGLSATV